MKRLRTQLEEEARPVLIQAPSIGGFPPQARVQVGAEQHRLQ